MQTEPEFPKLFVFDLDGTALGGDFEPYRRLPDPFSAFLDRLMARGCHWVINSAWEIGGQWRMVRASAVQSRPLYFVGGFALQLAELVDGDLQKVQPYTAEMEAEIYKIGRAHLRPIFDDLAARFERTQSDFRLHWLTMRPAPEDLARFTEYAWERYGEDQHISVYFAEGGTRFSAYPTAMNKGRGMKEIARRTGLSPDRVVVAGDAIGDVPMMSPALCAHAICPENAVKRVAAHVRERNGIMGHGVCCLGVLDAFNRLAQRHGWDWPTQP